MIRIAILERLSKRVAGDGLPDPTVNWERGAGTRQEETIMAKNRDLKPFSPVQIGPIALQHRVVMAPLDVQLHDLFQVSWATGRAVTPCLRSHERSVGVSTRRAHHSFYLSHKIL